MRQLTEAEIFERASDPMWRLENLYYIKTKEEGKQQFKFRKEQRYLLENMSNRNIILKARQLGFTTLIQLFLLDACLFRPHTNAGVIAHKADDAEAIFADKVKFAYDNLPDEIRELNPAKTSNKGELTFKNGSRIRVSVSLRSDTLQYLHISEYGKLCAQYPDKAKEVRSGTLNTVAPGGSVFIESTAEGRHGDFYEKCQEAKAMAESGFELTEEDYKFFFFPWYTAQEYRLQSKVEIPERYREYFEQFHDETGVYLEDEQKWWYVKKAFEQGDLMKQEFPGTPEEAFERTLVGAIFAQQLREVRNDGRITELPFRKDIPVDTFWDLGVNDYTSIWFRQKVGEFDHFIYFYEHRQADISHYIYELEELRKDYKWNWGTFHLPHDGSSRNIASVDGSVKKILRRQGYRVKVHDRPRAKLDSIIKARNSLAHCKFSREHCDEGLKALEAYRFEWDDKKESFGRTPVHDWASNAADAFQVYAISLKNMNSGMFTRAMDGARNALTNPRGNGYSRKKEMRRGKERGEFARL